MNKLPSKLKMIFFIARLAAPWVWMVSVFALRLMATSIISLWIGVPTALDRIANEWLDRAVDAGFPTEWDRTLYYVMWWLGLATNVIGWILFAHLTVFLTHLIF